MSLFAVSAYFVVSARPLLDAARRTCRLVPVGESFDVAAEDENEAYQAAAEYIIPLLQLLPPT